MPVPMPATSCRRMATARLARGAQRLWLASAALACAAASSACEGDPWAPVDTAGDFTVPAAPERPERPDNIPLAPVCDGSTNIVLRAAPTPGLEPEPPAVDRSVTVRGDCLAWTATNGFGELGQRQLTDEEADYLGATMGFARWPERYGFHEADIEGDDIGSVSFIDGGGTVTCWGGCVDVANDPVLREFSLARGRETLRSYGLVRVDGPGRLIAVESEQRHELEWHGSLPDLSRIAGHGVVDLATADAQRVRRFFEAQEVSNGAFVRSDGRTYLVKFADSPPE